MLAAAIRKFIGVSAFQAVIGSTVVGGSLLGIGAVGPAINGCPAAAQALIVRGELALKDGDLDRAKKVAHDGLGLSAKSPCVNLFAAEVEFELLKKAKAAKATRDADKIEVLRSDCFLHANRSATLFGAPPLATALMHKCSASAAPTESAEAGIGSMA